MDIVFFQENFCPRTKCGLTLPSPRSACPSCGSVAKIEFEETGLPEITISLKSRNLKVKVAETRQQGQEVDHKCPKCGHTKLTYQAQQTRSADEAITQKPQRFVPEEGNAALRLYGNISMVTDQSKTMMAEPLPILFYNLAGEMLFIIEQRLRVQNVAKSKGRRVLEEMVAMIFKSKLVCDIFTHKGPLLHLTSLRALFEKIIRSSTIRLNSSSMDKLFDLMIMAVKHQILLCRNPTMVLYVTFNHLRETSLLIENKELIGAINGVTNRFANEYGTATHSQWTEIRRSISNYFLGRNTRISTLLRDHTQREDGRIAFPRIHSLVKGVEVPGEISVFANDGSLITKECFPFDGEIVAPLHLFPVDANRKVTTLGLNSYKDEMDDNLPSPPLGRHEKTKNCNEEKLAIYRQKIQILLEEENSSELGDEIPDLLDLMDSID